MQHPIGRVFFTAECFKHPQRSGVSKAVLATMILRHQTCFRVREAAKSRDCLCKQLSQCAVLSKNRPSYTKTIALSCPFSKPQIKPLISVSSNKTVRIIRIVLRVRGNPFLEPGLNLPGFTDDNIYGLLLKYTS